MPVVLVASRERDPRKVVKPINLQQAYIRYREAERVVVDTEEHLDRLKAAAVEMLLGHQEAQDNVAPLNKAKDVLGCFDEKSKDDLQRWWGELLIGAQGILREGASEFSMHDDAEYDRRIQASMRRGR